MMNELRQKKFLLKKFFLLVVKLLLHCEVKLREHENLLCNFFSRMHFLTLLPLSYSGEGVRSREGKSGHCSF
jgi:hypothetical protein